MDEKQGFAYRQISQALPFSEAYRLYLFSSSSPFNTGGNFLLTKVAGA